jgi:hypothetical protein
MKPADNSEEIKGIATAVMNFQLARNRHKMILAFLYFTSVNIRSFYLSYECGSLPWKPPTCCEHRQPTQQYCPAILRCYATAFP